MQFLIHDNFDKDTVVDVEVYMGNYISLFKTNVTTYHWAVLILRFDECHWLDYHTNTLISLNTSLIQ